MSSINYIDFETYEQLTSETKDDYVNFLKNNPSFIDTKEAILSNIKKKQELEQEKIKQQHDYMVQKQKQLEERHRKDEDYRYIPSLVWLEMYLPRYELEFGKFDYSNKELTNKQKCEELLNYFGSVCGITDIKDIFKRKPRRGLIH